MCGIAGILGVPRDVAGPALDRMRRALAHRGPDGEGSLTIDAVHAPHAPPIGLTQTRLAIIDTSSAGLQPMRDRDGHVIVFNGEIYNYRLLQQELASRGFAPEGRTDTEVILRAYAAWGVDAVTRLRGMFAFCLVDPKRGVAWLARDRLGIKPLYVARPATGGLLFASEVRALLAAGRGLIKPRVSPGAVESFLAQGMVAGLDSIVDGVSLVPPGGSIELEWDGRERASRAFWSLPRAEAHFATRDDAVAEIRRTLREAVSLHLISDVPLGLFLSSGVDSTVLATIATEAQGHDVRTVAIGFDQPEFDESPEAARIAERLGTHHTTVQVTGDEMLRDVGEVFAALDQPTVDGFNTYVVSRAARRAGLTVALSGVGGDELFGGYATFRDVSRAVKIGTAVRMLLGRRASLGAKVPLKGRRGAKLAELLSRAPTTAGMYLLRRELFLRPERRDLLPLPPLSDAETGIAIDRLRELEEASRDRDAENGVSSLELLHYMRHMLLRDGDVMSMASQIELRVPLLDHVLVEAVLPLPGAWKRPDPRKKPLLLDAAGPRLPPGVGERRKQGFTFPWDAWLRGPMRDRAARALADRDVWRAVGIEADAPARMWSRFVERDARVGGLQVMALWVLSEFAQRNAIESG